MEILWGGISFWVRFIVEGHLREGRPIWSNLPIEGSGLLEPGMDFKSLRSESGSRYTVVIDSFRYEDWVDQDDSEKPFIQYLRSIMEDKKGEVYLGLGVLAIMKGGIYDMASTFLWILGDKEPFKLSEFRRGQ